MLYKAPTSYESPIETEYNALVATSPEARPLGYTLRSVDVPDMSEQSPDFALTNEALNELDTLLEQNPQWEAPRHSDDGTELILDPRNVASNALYVGRHVASTYQWRLQLVPSALALETLALKTDYLPTTDTAIDEGSRDVFLHGMDAVSIRTRGALMAELIAEHSADKNAETEQKWLSLACGAARPVLEAAARITTENATPIDVTLVDYDANILDYSSKLADEFGTVVRHREIESNLLRTMVARGTLVDELGAESMDVVDLLGFLEYCPDKAAVDMMANAYELVAPGGVLITANMRDDRPQKNFHLRGIGWPGVQMRSSDEVVELATKAGIDPSLIEAYQPTDGVYTVIKIAKPLAA